jgi:hypothetical protein
MSLFNWRKKIKLYRYISPTKVARLESKQNSLSAFGMSGLGFGLNFARQSQPPLTDRLNRVLKQLRKHKLINTIDVENSNFIEGTALFAEFFMKGVAIWISCTSHTVLLLGGSGTYLNFENFNKPELKHVLPGSNRTAYLNACTTLWRAFLEEGKPDVSKDPTWIDSLDSFHGALGDGREVKTTSYDEIPYPPELLTEHPLAHYYEMARSSYSFCQDWLIDDLEYAAIIHTDYTFPANVTWDERVQIHKGDRFVLGSPIYMAQNTPSGGYPKKIN